MLQRQYNTFSGISRQQRYGFSLKLQKSQQQLQPDFYQLIQLKQQIIKKQISTSQCSIILQQMIQKLTFPIVGIQILKDKFNQMNILESTGFKGFEIIQQKAESIYVQSIMRDLKKMENQQIVSKVTNDQIKNIIGEINWKINMEKSFYQSQVQQVGDHVDLMKFFQGVRNYQNWHENVKKQTIQHLKQKAHEIQINLTLKKGFLISKIQRFKIIYEKQHQRQFINKCKNIVKLSKIQKVSQKIKDFFKKQGFKQILYTSQQITVQQKVEKLFTTYWEKKLNSKIANDFSRLTKKLLKYRAFIAKLGKIIRSKQLTMYSTFMQRANHKKKIKNSNITLGLQKLNTFVERACKKIVLVYLRIGEHKINYFLNKILSYHLKQPFLCIKKQAQFNSRPKNNFSHKMKGKVLSQLRMIDSDTTPVDIRHTFLNWYIKGNQQKFAKQIYNIWLTGNTNKFTFFMRLKNLANQSERYKIKFEFKMFLAVLNTKFTKYYNHCQKNMLHKWVAKIRKLKKIQKMFEMLHFLQQQSNTLLQKAGLSKISNDSKQKVVLQRFCSKYLQYYITKAKTTIDTWKVLPDVKRLKGQKSIRYILSRVINNIKKTKVDTFNIFKTNKAQGRDIKISLLRKAFYQDFVYLQKYFQVWRINKNIINKQKSQFILNKTKSILLIQKYNRVIGNKNIKDAIKKFIQRSKINKNREDQLKKVMTRVLRFHEAKVLTQSFTQFKKCWQFATYKKNNLVRKLVDSNKKKQLVSLYLIKSKAQQLYNLEKIRQTQRLFTTCQDTFKFSFQIFDRSSFIFNVLNKLISNKTKNISICFKNIQALPNRIDWQKRNKAIKFHQILAHSTVSKKGVIFNRIKQTHMKRKYKVKRIIEIMASKYSFFTQRYFSKYRKNVDQLKKNQINKIMCLNFGTMDRSLINNFRRMFVAQSQWKRKDTLLKKIDLHVKKRLLTYLLSWHETMKQANHREKVKNQQKRRCLEGFFKINKMNEMIQTKKVIHMFKRNQKVSAIQIAFLKRLCDGTAGKAIKALMTWKGLPEPKNKQKIAKATKFEQIMSKISLKNLRKSYNAYKQSQYYGNQKKKVCIRQLVNNSCSGIKSYFQTWRNNNKLSIIFGQCESISHLIDLSHIGVSQNFKLLFEGNQSKLKKNQLQIVNNILNGQKKQIFNFWRGKTNELKMKDKRKTKLLQKLAQIRQQKQNKDVRDFVVRKFVELRLFGRLSIRQQKQVRVIYIFDKLNKKRIQHISETYQVFKFNHYKGNFKKKRAFENWIKDKVGQINSILGGWNNLAQQQKFQQKRTLLQSNMNCMDNLLRNNFVNLMASRRQLELKKKSLTNLIRTQQIRLKGFLLLWKNNVKQLKILSQLDKQTKSALLQRINKVVTAGSIQNVKKAIQKFHMSMKVQQIQKKFINQLLKTKSGMVVQALKRWRTIPVIRLGERYKKGQKFFNRIQAFYKGRKQYLYKTYKKQYDEGNLMKKQSILQLFEMTSTGIRRFYRRWQKMSKQTHTLNTVNQLYKSMQTIQSTISLQWMIIFQDQRQYRAKINAINRLIAASSNTTAHFFDRWRQNVKQLRIQQGLNNQKKTLAVGMFTKAIDGSQTVRIVDAIQRFRKNKIITDVSKKFFNRLLQTKTGKALSFIAKLKSIPDTKIALRKKKAVKFEGVLHRMATKIIRTTFNPFKNCNFIAIDRKKYCITKLIKNSMGEQHKKFSIWRNVTRQDKILQHSDFALKSFQNLQKIFSSHTSIIFKDAKKQVQKKKGLCRKLVMNSQFVQHHAFMIWKQTYRTDTIKIVKKQSKVRQILKNLINVHNNHEKKSTVTGFGSFRNLLLMQKMKQAAQIQSRIQQKSHYFIQRLQNLSKKRLNTFIDACRKSSIEQNFANKVSSLQQLFKNSDQVYSLNMLMLMRNQRQSLLIQNALNRIFLNFKVGTQKAFNLWRQQAKVLKLQQLMSNDKKKNVLDIMNKFLGNTQAGKLKKAIELFNTNFRQTKLQKDILIKIINCKAGKVPILFMKWKALPSQTGKKYKMKAMKFQNVLEKAYIQRMKFVNNAYKVQSYDAVVKKQFAIKKLIQATLSDSNRIFNKWRKISNQQKITQKISSLDRIFSFTQQNFVNKLYIFDKFRQENMKKSKAVQKLFTNQLFHLQDSYNRWRSDNKQFKYQTVNKILSKYTQNSFNKRFLRQGFIQIKQKYQIQSMKGYVNSLWKWKLANTQANYYEKFIKVFRQSEQLLNLSKLLNKKQCDTVHYAFGKIKQTSIIVFHRKVQLVEKYMKKKVSTYLNRIRKNAFKNVMEIWKGKYAQSIQVETLSDVLAKAARKLMLETFSKLKNNQRYLKKVQNLTNALKKYQTKGLTQSMKNIYRYGYYKIFKVSYDTVNKVKQFNTQSSFDSLINYGNMRKFFMNIKKVQQSAMIRFSFNELKKNKQKQIKQKLSILLLSQQIKKKDHKLTTRMLNIFRKNNQKAISSTRIYQIIDSKLLQIKKLFFNINQNDMKMVNLLQRFKKGTTIKNILDKQDKKLLQNFFNRLKKKQNKWIRESIRKFATRSSIRSTLAISLWRFKKFAQE